MLSIEGSCLRYGVRAREAPVAQGTIVFRKIAISQAECLHYIVVRRGFELIDMWIDPEEQIFLVDPGALTTKAPRHEENQIKPSRWGRGK